MDTLNLPNTLQDAQIATLPPTAYYISSFITPAEEAHILQKINSAPLPTWRTLSHRRLQAHPSPLSPSNTLLSAPLPPWLTEPIISRLLSLPLSHDTHSSPSPSPSPDVDDVFHASPHGKPNHVLINEYTPGQGIMPHEDGDAYFPAVCTVSLGAGVVYEVYPKSRPLVSVADSDSLLTGPELALEQVGRKWRVYQEPRSLLVTTGAMYSGCLHGIEGVHVDGDVRDGEGGVVNWGLLREETRREMEGCGGRSERGTRVSLTFRDVLKVKKVGRVFGGLGRR